MEQLLFQMDILWPAFAAGLLILATHVPLGKEVLTRGIIFLDLAIAQMAAFGVTAASLFWPASDSHIPQLLIAITTAVIGAIGLYSLRKRAVKVQEAIIGIVFILAATGSLLLLATDPHGGERLKTLLVGQILWFQASDLIPLALIYAAVVITWLTLKKKFGAWLFYPLFAVTITLSTQIVGVYLVFASLIIPSLATLNQHRASTKSFLIGMAGYGGGLIFAAIFDLPAGATIVWCLAMVALGYYLTTSLLADHQARTSKIETP
jgi:zinc/manganese transport system permease protein